LQEYGDIFVDFITDSAAWINLILLLVLFLFVSLLFEHAFWWGEAEP